MSAASYAAPADEALPKGETLLDRFIEVSGGKKAIEKHKSEVATISMEVVGRGIKSTGKRYADASNNLYEAMNIEGVGNIETGVFNGVVWETNPITGPRIVDGPEKADRLRDARFNTILYWRDFYKSAETTGVEEVNGEACYKVTLTPKEGKPFTEFYNKKSGMLVKMNRTVSNQMGELPVEVIISDYKSWDGVQMPMKISQKVMGAEMVMTMDDVKFDVEIPADRFVPPPDIQKLMKK